MALGTFRLLHPQFRIQGAAYLLPAPAHKWRAQFPDAQLAISDTNFAWDEERERFWRLLSPRMQNTFFGPPPGQPVPPIATAESSSLSPTPRPQHQIQSPHERNLREPNAIPESYVSSVATALDSDSADLLWSLLSHIKWMCWS